MPHPLIRALQSKLFNTGPATEKRSFQPDPIATRRVSLAADMQLSMLKSVIILAFCSLVFVLFCNIGFALEGNTRKGKFLYRKNCRTCHGSTATDLSPLSKTQAEWKALAENPGSIPCVKDWPEISEDDRKDCFSYLYTFAKDSPTPAKCE